MFSVCKKQGVPHRRPGEKVALPPPPPPPPGSSAHLHPPRPDGTDSHTGEEASSSTSPSSTGAVAVGIRAPLQSNNICRLLSALSPSSASAPSAESNRPALTAATLQRHQFHHISFSTSAAVIARVLIRGVDDSLTCLVPPGTGSVQLGMRIDVSEFLNNNTHSSGGGSGSGAQQSASAMSHRLHHYGSSPPHSDSSASIIDRKGSGGSSGDASAGMNCVDDNSNHTTTSSPTPPAPAIGVHAPECAAAAVENGGACGCGGGVVGAAALPFNMSPPLSLMDGAVVRAIVGVGYSADDETMLFEAKKAGKQYRKQLPNSSSKVGENSSNTTAQSPSTSNSTESYGSYASVNEGGKKALANGSSREEKYYFKFMSKRGMGQRASTISPRSSSSSTPSVLSAALGFGSGASQPNAASFSRASSVCRRTRTPHHHHDHHSGWHKQQWNSRATH